MIGPTTYDLPSAISSIIAALLESENRPSDIEQWRSAIASLDLGPSFRSAVSELRDALEATGYLIVRGLQPSDDILGADALLALCCVLGQPTYHRDDSATAVWRIAPSARGTDFSSSSDRVPLHTDSSFKLHPEKYFAILAVANDASGGESTFVSARHLVEELEGTARGQRCVSFLRQAELPFATPAIFSDAPPTITSKVLSQNPLIRFRRDVIERRLHQHPSAARTALDEIQYFSEAAESSSRVLTYKLKAGETLLINNHEMLHGRGSIVGARRLLLRVRFN